MLTAPRGPLRRRAPRKTPHAMPDFHITREHGGCAVVRLERPAKRNAVTLATWRALAETFSGLAADASVRALVVTGAGGDFCAGADIAEFERERADARAGAAYSAAVQGCVEALMASPWPTIAAIDGFCLGGGCSLAMACDFRIASAGARFGIPAARLGIVYGPTDTANLVHLVGQSCAKRILFTAEHFDAREALREGFVDRLAEGPALDAALAFARLMTRNSPVSIAGAKRVLHALAGPGTGGGDALDAVLAGAFESEDYREGVRAFLEHREPRFGGR